jgi:hypothetical protein
MKRIVSLTNAKTYLSAEEKSPRCCVTVCDHADVISVIKAISTSGFSAMAHVQASIPEEIDDGVKTSNGTATM